MRMSRAILTAAFAALALFAAAPACKTPVPADVPGEFTFHGVAVHPAAVKALYRSSTGLIDLAAFQTNLEAQQWEDQPGWWVTEFEEDPASGRSPFFAYAAFAGPVSGGAETYILSITFNEGEPADVDNIVLLQKSGTMLGLVRAWTEGSACDGGILAERMEDDNFLYARDLTPAAFWSSRPTRRLETQSARGPRSGERQLLGRGQLLLQPDRGPGEPPVGPPVRRARRGRKGPDRALSLSVLLQPALQRLSGQRQDRAPAQGSRRVRGRVQGRMPQAGGAVPAPAPVDK